MTRQSAGKSTLCWLVASLVGEINLLYRLVKSKDFYTITGSHKTEVPHSGTASAGKSTFFCLHNGITSAGKSTLFWFIAFFQDTRDIWES